jgi:hypothetical protein
MAEHRRECLEWVDAPSAQQPRSRRKGHQCIQIDDEGTTQGIIDAFVFIEISGIEKVARVLAVERSDDLTGIEIGERQNRYLGEAKLLFYFVGDALCLGIINSPSQHWRDVDLRCCTIGTDQEMGTGPRLPFRYGRFSDLSLHLRGYAPYRGVDRRERFRIWLYRKISEIDINR